MNATCRRLSLVGLLVILAAATTLGAQSTTGSIQGTVKDKQDAVVPGAAVTIRNVQTNASRTAVTDGNGGYRFLNVPVGDYELTVELSGFSKHVRSGLTLSLNQDAVVDVQIQPAGVSENVEVRADAPLLNTTNAEVGVRFDTTRISELPMMNSRDIFAVALSAPGVSQLGSGQSEFASGTNFSSNGMRLRSNNFMIDGQDSNDPSVTGRQQQLNNTDAIQEMRLITNQFAAEFGRAAGAVVNVVTRNGTNVFKGSAFAYINDESLNAMNNLDKRVLVNGVPQDKAPFREERQFGGTIGGPILRNRTFFFGSFQRWTDRKLGVGLHAQRRADRSRASDPAVGCRQPPAGAGAAQIPSGRAGRDGQERQLHGRRADLHRAARIVDRLVVGRLRQQPDVGPRRSSARAEPHADRPLPADRSAGRLRRRAGHAARLDDVHHDEPALAQHLVEQRPRRRTCRTSSASRGPTWARSPTRRTRRRKRFRHWRSPSSA